MNPKYSNIFWHQGVKIFSDNFIQSRQGQIHIHHLENDVTKSLINLFQHCEPKVLRTFLSLIQINESPQTFNFEFQVTDTNAFREKKNRIMLSIISTQTPIKFSPDYQVAISQPDACIYNQNTAILIEVKTQSPLINEQVENHIRYYLGSATKRRQVTWEDISLKFNQILKQLNNRDKFLISQFLEFLELIGLSEFKGFTKNDFLMLDDIGKMPREDYLDFKRIMHRKIDQFMKKIFPGINTKIHHKKINYRLAQVSADYPEIWSAFYFYDNDPEIHVNFYPNINFNFRDSGIELSYNAEVKSAMALILKKLNQDSDTFINALHRIKDSYVSLYYKLQFYPKDNFVWSLIPGFPIKSKEISRAAILSSIDEINERWNDYKKTLIFQMEAGIIKHPSENPFSTKQIEFAKKRNPKPNFVIRIEKRYEAAALARQKKKIIKFFINELTQFNQIINLVNQPDPSN